MKRQECRFPEIPKRLVRRSLRHVFDVVGDGMRLDGLVDAHGVASVGGRMDVKG